jgi:hypothetical protein
MVKSNEFKGATLAEAVKNATAAYRRPKRCEIKNQRRCNNLLLIMNNLSRQATRHADRAERLQSEADSLKREAAADFGFAAVAALSGVAAALLRLKRVLRVIGRARKGNISRADLAELLNLIGPAASALAVLQAISKFKEAERLIRDAEDFLDSAERIGAEYIENFDEYRRLGCGQEQDFVGS